MGLKFNDNIRIDSLPNIFNSYENHPDNVDNWKFEYITQDTYGDDQTLTDKDIDKNKNNYPLGTIFFDSHPSTIYLSSDVSNIIIDNTPPVAIYENIQYTTINENHKCSITFESDTMLDIHQIAILSGDLIFYQALRKNDKIITNPAISKISMSKHATKYELIFYINKNTPTKILNENQITIIVWDIAGNKCIYHTGDLTPDEQHYWDVIIKKDDEGEEEPLSPDDTIDTIYPLIIEFTDIQPPNMVVSDNVVGKVLVKVSNPNQSLWNIPPTIELADGSVGYLDKAFDYDPNTGVLLFYVTHITRPGFININAWITIPNKDLADLIKQKTYASNILEGWRKIEDGRLYNFKPYIPKYINDENYGDFVLFCQEFLNTCHTSLTTNNNISVLEKIARINNFRDPATIEQTLLDKYKTQFGIEITPNVSEFIYYLNNIPETYDVIEH